LRATTESNLVFESLFVKKEFLKFVSLVLSFCMVFNPLFVPVVYAQDAESGNEEVVEIVEVVDEQILDEELPEQEEQEQEEEVVGGECVDGCNDEIVENNIETGDADSNSQIETVVNQNEDIVPGEMESEGECDLPVGQTTCEEDVIVANENTVEATSSASSDSDTGDNEILHTSNDSSIETGDADSTSDLETQVNTNVVVFDDTGVGTTFPEEIKTEDEDQSTDSAQLEVNLEGDNGADVVVVNDNKAELNNDTSASSDTGENQASGDEDVSIDTGDAVAVGNNVNLVNTNIVSSEFAVFVENYLDGCNEDIDLNALWQELIQTYEEGLYLAGESESNNFLVSNTNDAQLENNLNVEANTGENTTSGNRSAEIETGDAIALANLVNVVNLNIIGSNFLFPIINIFKEFNGNLVLPTPESFISQANSGNEDNYLFINNNEAEIDNAVSSYSDTGGNSANNNLASTIETGDATSKSNSNTLVNANIVSSSWFHLLVNSLGDWNGFIKSWQDPEAVEQFEEESLELSLQGNELVENEGEKQSSSNDTAVVLNNNKAQLESTVNAIATTGGNEASNNVESEIKTGDATALANLVNLVNINMLGSNWFFGLVNVLGDWNGDIVFAYPDAEVVLTQLDQTESNLIDYVLEYRNIGYGDADDVSVSFRLPAGARYISDTSGLQLVRDGDICIWKVGSVAPKDGSSFTITVEIVESEVFEEELSFFEKLIPQAYAAEETQEKDVVFEALITTTDTESNMDNNSSAFTTTIYRLVGEESTGTQDRENQTEEFNFDIDHRQPDLQVSVWNNVNEYVYNGDTVTFEITIENVSDVTSYDTVLYHSLYDGLPEDIGTAIFDVGDLLPGEVKTLSFGMYLSEDQDVIWPGNYRTESQAFGFAFDGGEISSNLALSHFTIKGVIVPQVYGAIDMMGGKEGEVLAVENSCPTLPPQTEDMLPYLLLFMVSSLGLIERRSIIVRLKERLVK
jgi:hypothetical protein